MNRIRLTIVPRKDQPIKKIKLTLMLVEDGSFDPTCTSTPQKEIPTFFPETPTFYEKDRIKAKKQISRRELLKRI
jgi:hypothetical protein